MPHAPKSRRSVFISGIPHTRIPHGAGGLPLGVYFGHARWDVVEAHAAVESGHGRGKVVLIIDQGGESFE